MAVVPPDVSPPARGWKKGRREKLVEPENRLQGAATSTTLTRKILPVKMSFRQDVSFRKENRM